MAHLMRDGVFMDGIDVVHERDDDWSELRFAPASGSAKNQNCSDARELSSAVAGDV